VITKLKAAGYENILHEAIELKELISKLIVKYQHYNSAQKIITLLLAEVESIFNSKIKPLLIVPQTEEQVLLVFRDLLETEILNELGENVLEIFHRQIKGMVFFLTGNCHLEWN
jgi:hypothetical protein